MRFISLMVFIIVQIIFVPLFIIGAIITSVKQLLVSKKLGVSSTAISAIAARWQMNAWGIRKDSVTEKLYRSLPNGSEIGLWLILFPSFLRYKIYPKLEEEGKEGIINVPIARTFYFDKLINKINDKAEQFIIMGSGYDTRSYGDLKNKKLRFFEMDQENTQKLKIECLKKAGIDTSHVTFVVVDFSTDKWYEKLKSSGYDPGKKSIFLWEGVTLYISENDIRKTIKELQEHTTSGSFLLVDFYSKRLTAMQGVKATNENFHFGLDLSSNEENVLRTFLESANVKLGDFHFIGNKTKKGAFGVVTEIVL